MSKGSCEAAESTVGVALRMARAERPIEVSLFEFFLEEINHESIWCE